MTKGTSRAGGRGRSKEALASREADILESVVSLLTEGGFAAVTTDAVADRADVSKATIYRKWSTKSELILAALERVIQPIAIPDEGSFEAEITAFLEHRLEQYSTAGVNRLFAGVIGRSAEDPVLADTFHAWVAQQMSANVEIIDRAIERGEVDAGVSVDSIATMIAAPLVYRLVWERRTPDRELLECVVSTLVRALHPATAEAAGRTY